MLFKIKKRDVPLCSLVRANEQFVQNVRSQDPDRQEDKDPGICCGQNWQNAAHGVIEAELERSDQQFQMNEPLPGEREVLKDCLWPNELGFRLTLKTGASTKAAGLSTTENCGGSPPILILPRVTAIDANTRAIYCVFRPRRTARPAHIG